MDKKANNQGLLKALLLLQTIGLLVYTFLAIQNDGPNFLLRAKAFVSSLTWMGQFALDFSCYLMLSGLWIMWRNKFRTKGIVIAFAAMVLGIVFFAPYLIYLLRKEQGNLKNVLLGDRKVA